MRDVGKQRRTPSSLFAQGAQGQTAGQRLSARTKFASANSIFSLAVCFGRPRYRVFRYRNCPFMTANTCSTLARTDDFWCSAFFALLCPLADSFLICVGLRLCLYLIFLPCLFRTMASCRFSAPIYPLSPYNSLRRTKTTCSFACSCLYYSTFLPDFQCFCFARWCLNSSFFIVSSYPFRSVFVTRILYHKRTEMSVDFLQTFP